MASRAWTFQQTPSCTLTCDASAIRKFPTCSGRWQPWEFRWDLGKNEACAMLKAGTKSVYCALPDSWL
eukprot:705734-Rhodomonas_salina.1